MSESTSNSNTLEAQQGTISPNQQPVTNQPIGQTPARVRQQNKPFNNNIGNANFFPNYLHKQIDYMAAKIKSLQKENGELKAKLKEKSQTTQPTQ